MTTAVFHRPRANSQLPPFPISSTIDFLRVCLRAFAPSRLFTDSLSELLDQFPMFAENLAHMMSRREVSLPKRGSATRGQGDAKFSPLAFYSPLLLARLGEFLDTPLRCRMADSYLLTAADTG